jgi:hypothetical protein
MKGAKTINIDSTKLVKKILAKRHQSGALTFTVDTLLSTPS